MSDFKVAILGLGTAGVFTARALANVGFRDFLVIGKIDGNSYLSPWNLRVEDDKTLYTKLVQNIDNPKDKDKKYLLKYLAKNHTKVFLDLIKNEWKDVSFTKSVFGFKPETQKPGKMLLKPLIDKYIPHLIDDEVLDLKQDSNQQFLITLKNGQQITAQNIILASGGMGRLSKATTGDKTRITNLAQIVQNLGGVYEDKGFMKHPFLLKDKDIPNALVSGYFIVNADFYLETLDTSKKVKFLSPELQKAIKNDDYHHLFPEIEAEFQLAAKQGRIILSSRLTKKQYDNFVKNNEYGDVFAHKEYGDWLKNVEITIGEHYTIGGLKIDKNLLVEGLNNVYAIGEVASLYGGRRMGGMGHIDSMTLASLLARNIKRKYK